MPFGWAAAAVVGTTLYAADKQEDAAQAAAGAQTAAADRGIEEQRRQFDEVVKLLKPYVEAGGGALDMQKDLLGMGGPEMQAAAIKSIEQSPEMMALTRQGEEAILARASATGGLRGGNTQSALAQFRPALLSQLINDRFAKLGGITQMGQASAAGQAAAGMQTGTNVSNLFGQIGAAQAGSELAQGNAAAGAANSIGSSISSLGTLRLLGKW